MLAFRTNYNKKRPKMKTPSTPNMRNFRIASWNISTMRSKSIELEQIMRRRRISILTVQETKWKNGANKARYLDLKTKNFKIFYAGDTNERNGVGVIVDASLLDNIVEIIKISDRLMCLKIVIDSEIWNIVSPYAPQINCGVMEKQKFWTDFNNLLSGISSEEKLFIGGDLNGHVGGSNDSYEDCHGGFGLGTRNEAGEEILNFCKANELFVLNTMFSKEAKHLTTYTSGGHNTQIDYHLCPKYMRKLVKNTTVIRKETLEPHHHLLVTEFFHSRPKKCHKQRPEERIRWNQMDMEGGKKFVAEMQAWLYDLIDQHEDLTCQEMWDNLHEVCIFKAKEHLGVWKNRHHIDKETWWWNEETAEAVKNKDLACQAWTTCDPNKLQEKEKLRLEYKRCKKIAKKTVARCRAKAAQALYDELEELTQKSAQRNHAAQEIGQSGDNGTRLYKIAAQRRKNAKEIQSPKFIEDADGHLLTSDQQIKNRWFQYCNELFNEEFPSTANPIADPHFEEVPDFTEEEMSRAVKRMKRGKAVGPDKIPSEFWVKMGDVGCNWLTIFVNKLKNGDQMPRQWRTSYSILLYKGKGDTRKCNNYRTIKLMVHTLKICERVLDSRIRERIDIDKNQCGFVGGKSTVDAIQSLKILIEKHRDAEKDWHMIFIDLLKAFDRVPRHLIWIALRAHNIPEVYVKMIQDMYDDTTTMIKCASGLTEEMFIKVGVHQGSVLSPVLFIIVMYFIVRGLNTEDVVVDRTFADDIVLASSDADALQRIFNKWAEAIESHGLRISRTKTETLSCLFSNQNGASPDFCLKGEVLPKCNNFKYLGSILSQNGDCESDVNHRVSVGWNKWRENSGIFCDPKMPPKLKGKLHTTVIRPALLYNSESWTMKTKFRDKMTAAEMKMLRISSGVTKLDHIRSSFIRGSMHIRESISEKLEQRAVNWWEHVKRRPADNPIHQSIAFNVPKVKKVGRPKSNWLKQKELQDLVKQGSTRCTRQATRRQQQL